MAQREIHAFDGNGKYAGVYIATDEQFSKTGLTEGTEPVKIVTSYMINLERDRRIDAGFTFDGHVFQADDVSLRKINGAATGAIIAKGLGADPTSANWAADGSEFSWVSADNTIIPMSPDAVLAFGMTALAHVDAHTKSARVLKDTPQDDYAADAHWPSVV